LRVTRTVQVAINEKRIKTWAILAAMDEKKIKARIVAGISNQRTLS